MVATPRAPMRERVLPHNSIAAPALIIPEMYDKENQYIEFIIREESIMKQKYISFLLSLALILPLFVIESHASLRAMPHQPKISAGFNHTAGIDENNVLWMWGDNSAGQLGVGLIGNASAKVGDEDSPYQTVPLRVMDDVVSVGCGTGYTAALKSDGSLWTWGSNEHHAPMIWWGDEFAGKLGNGTTKDSLKPVKILTDVVSVSTGDGHAAAIKSDGTLWIWGNIYWEDETKTLSSTTPILAMDDVVSVNCGDDITGVIKSDGTLWMWGYDWSGAFGGGMPNWPKIVGKPIKVMDDVIAVSCSNGYVAAIKSDGSLWTWGMNSDGELGQGTTGNSATPAKVMEDVKYVSCGKHHTAAIKNDNTLWIWGGNGLGQLGLGGNTISNEGEPHPIPVKIMDDVVDVACGGRHSIAVKKDGTVWTWGSNDLGELGNGGVGNAKYEGNILKLVSQTVPVQLAGLRVATPPAKNETADPTNDKLAVNGVTQTPTVYKIGGSNYFKIRDVAAVLNGTEKQFAVGYSGGKVTVTSGQPYEATGKELAGAPDSAGEASPSNDAIVIDGVETGLTVYKIGGSNYFKLRDLGEALNFYVGWEAGRGVFIETDRPYSK